MTALEEYSRLETTGLWRSAPDAQLREVGLSFGDATLVISDSANRPLGHWSLPAIRRINPSESPAIFSPDSDAFEILEIEDTSMIEALDKIHKSLTRHKPRHGKLRRSISLSVLAASAAIAIFWLPGALTRQTLSVVPLGKRAEIGATLLGHMQSITGQTCRDSLGIGALTTVQNRVLGPDSSGQIVVVPDALAAPVYLPGGIIVLPRSILETTDDPNVLAGHILAAAISRERVDPLERALKDAGLGATFQLLTTGDIPTEALQSYAARLVSEPAPLAHAEALGAGFEIAQIPISPWAYALDPSGETIEDLLAVEWTEGQDVAPTLSDGNWISLQSICR